MSIFSPKKLFADSSVSAVLDRMFYEITAGMPEGFDLATCFCLTGRVAAILQGADQQDCDNVIFITNDTELYSFIQFTLPKKLPNDGVIIFKERTLFYFPGMYLELWYTEEELNITVASGVNCQLLDDINEIML